MTGVLSSSPSRKRKHRPTEDSDAIPGAPKKKKEKRHKATVQSVAPPLEDVLSSQERRPPKSPKDKGKSCALDLPSEFRVVNTSLILSIPPVFASDLRAGVEEMLDTMIMRYVPSLQGVLLAHSNIRFLSQTASIHGDCPFAVCNVSFDATVWGPQIAMKLVGRINVCSPDHISLLVHRTFNVSIPRHHIPQDQWLFEYGPAENDPEFGGGRDWDAGGESKGAGGAEGDIEINDFAGLKVSGESREVESSGFWVHHLTGSKLGDPDGYVEFTVIGLTVANEMLSLQGSIQPDPFSPEHVPHSDRQASTSAFPQDETSEVETRAEGSEEEEEDDGFKHLARLTDAAEATQKVKCAEEEEERLGKGKKRKQQGVRDAVGPVGESSRPGKRAERKRIRGITS